MGYTKNWKLFRWDTLEIGNKIGGIQIKNKENGGIQNLYPTGGLFFASQNSLSKRYSV